MDPLISIVYVNYNTSQLLIDSIKSVKDYCPDVSYEIIIVDNNSENAQKSILTDWLLSSSLENVRLILSDNNSGFSVANNSGAELAKGKYLFFLNPDTLVLNNVLQLFCNFMEASDDTIAACGGNLLRADMSPNDSYGNFPGLMLEICNIGLGLSFLLGTYYKKHIAVSCKINSDKIMQVSYIVGADMFVKAEYFRKIGGFDENYFMYYEETDIFFRFEKNHFRSFVLPEARIIHFEGASVGNNSSKSFNYNKFQMLMKSKLYFYQKWSPKLLKVIQLTVLMQIFVQFLKGKWGNDLKRLISIYQDNL
jgi:GT2 family glycosyltransferase